MLKTKKTNAKMKDRHYFIYLIKIIFIKISNLKMLIKYIINKKKIKIVFKFKFLIDNNLI